MDMTYKQILLRISILHLQRTRSHWKYLTTDISILFDIDNSKHCLLFGTLKYFHSKPYSKHFCKTYVI